LRTLLRQSIEAWWIIAKLTIPALIVVRILVRLDLVGYISVPFEPVMALIGLPKEAALAWVTAMLTNNYTGVVVYLDLLPVMGPQTVLQATITGSLILIAHNLPVESGVCRGAGVSPLRMTVLRIGGALVYGALIHRLATMAGVGAGEASFVLELDVDPNPPWGVWLVGCLKSLLAMWLIVTSLLLIMAGFRKVGLIKLLTAALSPLMRLAGVGPKATMITIIGMLLGLAYGGGLIIAESRSGRVPAPDIYGSITLMALCHSLLEDTIILAALGGSLWGLLAGRLVFSVALTGVIVRAARRPGLRPLLVGRKYAG
jgi:spore maturation protein SpmB